MAGWFVVPSDRVSLRSGRLLRLVFRCSVVALATGRRCCGLSGLMQEALGSDALSPALLCHQDGLLPDLQDICGDAVQRQRDVGQV